LSLSNEKPVSKCAFQMQLAPLQRGASPNLENKHGETPLTAAVKVGLYTLTHSLKAATLEPESESQL
jgi:hypothetical protein